MTPTLTKAVEAGARALAPRAWAERDAAKTDLAVMLIGHKIADSIRPAEAVLRAALPVIMEEVIGVAEQWAEARLDDANAPIISGDVFRNDAVFVSSTASAHAGYRLLDLATAQRAKLAEIMGEV